MTENRCWLFFWSNKSILKSISYQKSIKSYTSNRWISWHVNDISIMLLRTKNNMLCQLRNRELMLARQLIPKTRQTRNKNKTKEGSSLILITACFPLLSVSSPKETASEFSEHLSLSLSLPPNPIPRVWHHLSVTYMCVGYSLTFKLANMPNDHQAPHLRKKNVCYL